MNSKRCYKVTVNNANSRGDCFESVDEYGDTTFMDCKNWVVYIVGECFADVEKAVRPESIAVIEDIGPAYVPD